MVALSGEIGWVTERESELVNLGTFLELYYSRRRI